MRDDGPKYFLDPLDSTTSINPGRKASTLGTWFARIPMSPVAAAIFTCTASTDWNRVCAHAL